MTEGLGLSSGWQRGGARRLRNETKLRWRHGCGRGDGQPGVSVLLGCLKQLPGGMLFPNGAVQLNQLPRWPEQAGSSWEPGLWAAVGHSSSSSPSGQLLLCRIGGSERPSDLPKVTQPLWGRAGSENWEGPTSNPCSCPLFWPHRNLAYWIPLCSLPAQMPSRFSGRISGRSMELCVSAVALGLSLWVGGMNV